MILTVFELNKGDNCLILTIKPLNNAKHLQELISNFTTSLRLGKEDIEYIKKTLYDECTPEKIAEHFVYTLAREYMKKITKHLSQSTYFINDDNLVGAIIQYCRQIDKDEIQIMSKETYEDMINETILYINDLFGEILTKN